MAVFSIRHFGTQFAGMLRANPADGAILPTIVEYEIPEMSVEQISHLLEVASAFPAPFAAMVHIALLTGNAASRNRRAQVD